MFISKHFKQIGQKELLPYIHKRQTGWVKDWKTCELQVSKALESFFSKEESLSEVSLFNALPSSFPALFIGNSMPIRDADGFFFPRMRTGPIFANRGLSGIDGNIATCAGIAAHTPLLAVIGDQTALHDLNSPAMLRTCKYPVTLIILNNGGGGIFSFMALPPKPDVVEKLFAASHSYTFEKAAALFHLPYAQIEQREELSSLFGKTQIIEIRTNRSDNVALHYALDECIAASLNNKMNSSILSVSKG